MVRSSYTTSSSLSTHFVFCDEETKVWLFNEEYTATTERNYLLKLIDQMDMVIKRMHWKVIDQDIKGNSIKIETHRLNSKRTPSPINELTAFENDLTELVKNIKFWTVYSQIQRTLKSDIKSIKQSSKTLTPVALQLCSGL